MKQGQRKREREKLNIAMLGHKRIPSREGGIEIVVEELSIIAKRNLLQADLRGTPAIQRAMISQGLGFHHRDKRTA